MSQPINKYLISIGKDILAPMSWLCVILMCFTFALSGWEGSVHDAKIFMETLRTPRLKFPYSPEGKYYLVDSRYPSFKGFMGPYRNTRRKDSSDISILENLENINELQDNEQNVSDEDDKSVPEHNEWQDPTQEDIKHIEEMRNAIRDQFPRRGQH
ncbi:uncharacterized protein [Medicago truncatula]|uniref:uncharacterized protein n=1 Tax=Medicago truncatula TaxID=3880 RepID=UPI000D2F325F|nr:uncharacterized protein LOC112416640 [Medicago truncatula]